MDKISGCKIIKILAFIPARGGSKRIPGKNLKLLCGKPLLYYAIRCAQKSKYINRIIVSTNDIKISAAAKKFGAEVPFLRPRGISGEKSTELQAFEHMLKWLKNNEGYTPDIIVKLFPTSPFRRAKSVDEAIKLFLSHPEADSLRSVRLCSEHPYKMWKIQHGQLVSLMPVSDKPKEAHTLSYQALPAVYIQNAAIDVTRPSNILKKKSITGNKIIPYIMNEIESIDINTPLDFIFAEKIFGLLKKEKLKLK
jgi:CMP-N,N'-diacetyllegionaminic acid synthase